MISTRREVIKMVLSICAGASVYGGKIGDRLRTAYAKVKKVLLPKGTKMSTLISKDPAELDAGNLDTTPMTEFDVMGQTEHKADLNEWRLSLTGAIETPKIITYVELDKLPSIERNVLLICPGFFAYNGLWKGVAMAVLLSDAKLKPGVTHVKFSGPKGSGQKSKEFSIEEVMTEKVFLAYQVNGKPLPQRHGFPLRLVAEDHYGEVWVKYVDNMTVIAKSAEAGNQNSDSQSQNSVF